MAEDTPMIYENKIRVENKDVFVDVKKNDNGIYLKISERNRNNRSTILIPSSGIEKLRDVLTDALAALPNNNSNNNNNKKTAKAAPTTDNAKKEKVLDDKKVCLTSLAYSVSAQELQEFCNTIVNSKNIVSVEVLLRRGRSLGVGVVEFNTAQNAKNAIAELNDQELKGRKMSAREYYE
eukprot:TRINITY_DN26887_c0_g1_i1.p1 TRINITY_DN26887_c0_g1~~TRINITY_DN26887_c0_g1_i1.p1  ORF type:complete len:179 (-),score=10.92 TRINITY_DN26887_c0_g1_i1:115-651(-)